MACSKVIYDGSTLMDLTQDTVTAGTLFKGVAAHGANGEAIIGAAEVTVLNGVLHLPAGLISAEQGA